MCYGRIAGPLRAKGRIRGRWGTWRSEWFRAVVVNEIAMSLEENKADLLENLEPNIFGPVRRDGCKHKGLQLDVTHYNVLVHTDTSSSRHLTVVVTGTGEVVKTGLQCKLEVGTKKRSVGTVYSRIELILLLVVLLSLTNQSIELVVEQLVRESVSSPSAQSVILCNFFNPPLQRV